MNARTLIKRGLAHTPDAHRAAGTSILTYHRVGGHTRDELDIESNQFVAQLDVLAAHDVVSLDEALDRLESGDDRPTVVLTFDDGFGDVYTNAWPLLRERRLPFVVYVVGGLIGGRMRWEGSTGESQGSPALSWAELKEMHGSGLCTIGNHTFSHARLDEIDTTELDCCSEVVAAKVGRRPSHFAWPWGTDVPELREALRMRFRSVATGAIGRNLPGHDVLRLDRIPVRRTDPLPFFRAKLSGDLRAERLYAGAVGLAKRTVSLAKR